MKKLLLFVILTTMFPATESAGLAEMTSTSFRIYGANMNAGGNVPVQTNGGAGSFILGTSLGQSTAIGESQDVSGTVFWNGAGFWYQLAALTHDSDMDGIPDMSDNCTLVPNADQRDTNGDGFGNMCDGDLNNDGNTNATDLTLFKQVYRGSDPDADFNGDGFINATDLTLFKGLYRKAPGPSGLVP